MRWGRLRLDGHVVIGRPEADHPLTEGSHLGGGGGIELELACDPVEGGPVLARGQSGALRFWPPRFRVGWRAPRGCT